VIIISIVFPARKYT